MFHFHEKSVDGNCAVRSSRIPYFLARKLFYTTAFPSLSAVIAGRETSRSGGAGMPKDFYWGSIFLPKCRYPILWRNLFPSIALLSGEFLIPYLLPKAQQRLGVGLNLVRVRKFEILHRFFKVQISSKFENKFTNLNFFPF